MGPHPLIPPKISNPCSVLMILGTLALSTRGGYECERGVGGTGGTIIMRMRVKKVGGGGRARSVRSIK